MAVRTRRPAPSSSCREPLGSDPLTWTVSPSRCWVRWPGPAQRPLVNRVRVGRQQLSAGMAGCRSQPGRRTELRGERTIEDANLPISATSAGATSPPGSGRAGSHRQSSWIGSPIMADTPSSPSTAASGPGDSTRSGVRTTWCGRCAAPCATTGCRTPISSADRGVPARPRRRGSWPRRSTARRPSTVEPCGVCTSCVEITQGARSTSTSSMPASNNGVDAMRDLVAHASLGTPGRWKVYIVDEVHMLSAAAVERTVEDARGASEPRRLRPRHHRPAEGSPDDPQPDPAPRVPTPRGGDAAQPGRVRQRGGGAGSRRRRPRGRRPPRAGLGPRRTVGSGPGRRGGVRRRSQARAGPCARGAGRRRREPGPGCPECAGGGGLGSPAAGDRAHRRSRARCSSRRWHPSCVPRRARRSSVSPPWPRRWDCRGSCAASRSWATRWSTCARHPTCRSCSRSPSCGPCGRTWTRGWRRCRSG